MARKAQKVKSIQGQHLAELRKMANLSQHELADLVGISQSTVAFWEQSPKPPRSDILPKLAEILGVSVEDIIHTSLATKLTAKRRGPIGKVREVFEEVSKLPRRQQEKVVEFVSAFVKQYEERRQSHE